MGYIGFFNPLPPRTIFLDGIQFEAMLRVQNTVVLGFIALGVENQAFFIK